MPTVNLTPYDAQLAEVQRQRQLAQVLQQQAMDPISVSSFNGIPAQISPYQGIAKVAQAIAAAFARGNADKDAKDLETQQRQAATDALTQYYSPTTGGVAHDVNLQNMPPQPQPQMPPQPAPQPGPPQLPGATDPTAIPLQTAPQQQAPQLAPQPPMVQQAPESTAVTGATPNTAMNRTQLAAQAMASGNPYLSQIAPTLYNQAAQQAQQEKLAQAVDISSLPPEEQSVAKQMLLTGDTAGVNKLMLSRAQDVADKQKAIAAVGSMTNLTPETRPIFMNAAMTGGTKAVQDLMSKAADAERPATPDELKGYPAGTVGRFSPLTGKLSSVYNPSADEDRKAQLKIAQAHLGIAQQELALHKDQAAQATLAPQTISYMAGQILAGDPSPLQNVGRGAQSAGNLALLRNEVVRQAQARGVPPDQLAAINAKFFGQKAEARAVGQRVGATGVAMNEVPPLAAEALNTHAALPTSDIVPFNRALQMYQSGTSSPELAQAVVANLALKNAYARSFGTGAPTVHAQQEAAKLLDNAWGTPAYAAAVQQIQTSIGRERTGAQAAMTGLGANPQAATAPPPPPFRPPPGAMYSPSRQQYKLPNGQLLDINGRPVGG